MIFEGNKNNKKWWQNLRIFNLNSISFHSSFSLDFSKQQHQQQQQESAPAMTIFFKMQTLNHFIEMQNAWLHGMYVIHSHCVFYRWLRYRENKRKRKIELICGFPWIFGTKNILFVADMSRAYVYVWMNVCVFQFIFNYCTTILKAITSKTVSTELVSNCMFCVEPKKKTSGKSEQQRTCSSHCIKPIQAM